VLLAELCPSLEIHTFEEDHRTKNLQLHAAKIAVRNAKVTPMVLQYLQSLQYEEGVTDVDVLLCARIRDMKRYNQQRLGKNPEPHVITYTATTSFNGQCAYLSYSKNGIDHILSLKKNTPVMIVGHCQVTTNTNSTIRLGPGTIGTVYEMLPNSVRIKVNQLGDGVIVEVKPVLIVETHWKQIPLNLCYASTIAKCIGFEFDKVAIDFGIDEKSEEATIMDSQNAWRTKQAYTAISRAKQSVFFIGPLNLALLNNMDLQALQFFNSRSIAHQARLNDEPIIVRDVYEMKEFWFQNDAVSHEEISMMELKNDDIFRPHEEFQAVIEGQTVKIYANKYPHGVIQNVHGRGYIVAARSQKYPYLLLKKQSKSLASEDLLIEVQTLIALKGVQGVLHLYAQLQPDSNAIILEGMPERVEWGYFMKYSSKEAKLSFKMNLIMTMAAIHQKQVHHGTISQQTVWTDIKGNVKITWFGNLSDFTKNGIQKDNIDRDRLCMMLDKYDRCSEQKIDECDGNTTYDDDIDIENVDNDDDVDDNDDDDGDGDDDDGDDDDGDDDDDDCDVDDDGDCDGDDDDDGDVDDDGDDCDDDEDDDVDDDGDDCDDDGDDDGDGDSGSHGDGDSGGHGDDDGDGDGDGDGDCDGDDDGDGDGDDDSDDDGDSDGDDIDHEYDEHEHDDDDDPYDSFDVADKVEWLMFHCDSLTAYTHTLFQQMILFSLQGSENTFELKNSLILFGMTIASKTTFTLNLFGLNVHVNDFGSSLQPFVHPSIWQYAQDHSVRRLLQPIHSLVVHLAIAMNISPIALDAIFWRNQGHGCMCKVSEMPKITSGGNVWLPQIFCHCWPLEFKNYRIIILNEICNSAKLFYSDHGAMEEIVLRQCKDDSFSLLLVPICDVLKNMSSDDLKTFKVECCESLSTLAVKEINIPNVCSSEITSQSLLRIMWNHAIKEFDLSQDKDGRWMTRPPGLSQDQRLQDGSLQDSGWKFLKDELKQHYSKDRLNVVDFGSEGGYCMAQFATLPEVTDVTGKEIQYPWIVYSTWILYSIHVQSKKQNLYFANVTLLYGSFLDPFDERWNAKIRCADIVHLDNWNWWKSQLPQIDVIIPKLKGNSTLRKSTDCNVAFALRRNTKLNAILIVYIPDHFQIGFQTLNQFKVKANWNSVGTTSISFLQKHELIPFELNFNATPTLNLNGFTCHCGVKLTFEDRLCIDNIYVCKFCTVSIHNSIRVMNNKQFSSRVIADICLPELF
jgi:hypothetical protein